MKNWPSWHPAIFATLATAMFLWTVTPVSLTAAVLFSVGAWVFAFGDVLLRRIRSLSSLACLLALIGGSFAVAPTPVDAQEFFTQECEQSFHGVTGATIGGALAGAKKGPWSALWGAVAGFIGA